jgi:serine/threonine protein phosphatase PrpC
MKLTWATSQHSGGRPYQQDTFLAVQLHNDYYIFAILDGHGTNGGLISNYVRQRIESKVTTLFNNGIDSLSLVFHALNDLVKTDPDIDAHLSGTTLTLAIIKDNTLYTANVGDSTAYLLNRHEKSFIPTKLTQYHPLLYINYYARDHNCQDKAETDRIIASGGRIEAPDNNGTNKHIHKQAHYGSTRALSLILVSSSLEP